MVYPFKYPMLYGELAMQGKTKKDLGRGETYPKMQGNRIYW